MFCKKINETGDYQPFPGFTVVADVYSPNESLFRKFYEEMSACPALKDYVNLLPPESYHITAFSIIEQKKIPPKQWTAWIKSHLKKLRSLHANLESQTNPYAFRISGIKKNRLTLLVEIDPAEAEVEKQLAASDIIYANNLPYAHHVSLGYQFKKFENKAAERPFNAEFQRIFATVFPTYETDSFQAMQPKLCYFNDMTKFIPWDATEIPPFTSMLMAAEEGAEVGSDDAAAETTEAIPQAETSGTVVDVQAGEEKLDS